MRKKCSLWNVKVFQLRYFKYNLGINLFWNQCNNIYKLIQTNKNLFCFNYKLPFYNFCLEIYFIRKMYY